MKKLTALLLALSLALSLALTGCGGKDTDGGKDNAGTGEQDQQERVINFALATDWGSLNPYDTTNTMKTHYVTVDKIYDKLVYVDQHGEVCPRAAKSWKLSEDGLVLDLVLDEKATWHDGEPVTAADWVWTINYMTSSFTTQHGFGKFLAGVDPESGVKTADTVSGAEAVSDYELKLTFNTPTADADQWLRAHSNTTCVLPQHLLQEFTDETVTTAPYFNKPVGSGPCVIDEIKAGSSIVTHAHAQYQFPIEGWDTMILQYVDSSTWIPKISAGDVDVCETTVNPSTLQGYEDDESIAINLSDDIEGGIGLVFNCLQVPTKIRKAVDRVIDKEWIIASTYAGMGKTSYSLILPSNRFYAEGIGGRDVEGAKKLVEEAVADGVWSADKVLNIYYKGTTSEALAKQVKADAESIGIKVELQAGEINTVNAAMFSNEPGYTALVVNLGLAADTPIKGMITYMEQYDSYSHTHLFRAESEEGYEGDYNTFLGLFGQLSSGQNMETATKAYQEWEYENAPQSELATYYQAEVVSPRMSGTDTAACGYNNHAVWNWAVK